MEVSPEYPAFVEAADAKDFDTLLRLLREHPHLVDEGPWFDVIFTRCREFFEVAFKAGIGPDCGPALLGETLLQRAASDSDLDLVRLCLRFGADIERRNDEGETALGYAASWGSLETVQLLVESGADVNAIEGTEPFYSTALDAAYDREDVHQYLRSKGAKTYRELKEQNPQKHS